MRFLIAAIGAAFIAVIELFGTIDFDPPGGRAFWASTAGTLFIYAVIVAFGFALGRWWAVLLALVIVVVEAVVLILGFPRDFEHDAIFTIVGVAIVGGLLWFGVFLRQLVARHLRGRVSGR